MNKKSLHDWLHNYKKEQNDNLLIQDYFLNMNFYQLMYKFGGLSTQLSKDGRTHYHSLRIIDRCRKLLGEEIVNKEARIKDIVNYAYRCILDNEQDYRTKEYYDILYDILIRPFAEVWQKKIEPQKLAEFEESEREGAYFEELTRKEKMKYE